MAKAAKIIAVANEKGGVGKSMITMQVSMELAKRGKKVLVIDNDPSFDVTTNFLGDNIPESISQGASPNGVSNTYRLFETSKQVTPVSVTDKLSLIGSTDILSTIAASTEIDKAYDFRDNVESFREQFDYILIDCPPSFGLIFTASMLTAATGGVVIPVNADELSAKAASKVKGRIDAMKRMNENVPILGVVANRIKNPKPQSVRYFLDKLAEEFGKLMFQTELSDAVKVADACSLNVPISDHAKRSKSAQQISDLTDEIVNRLRRAR